MARVINFEAEWDPEAEVWWASAEDGVGIATEAETIDKLRERLRLIVPDFFEATGQDAEDIEINLTIRVTDFVRAAGRGCGKTASGVVASACWPISHP